MTKDEAILISAYTGYLFCENFSEVHKFCEKLLERPILSPEFAIDKVIEEIQAKCKPLIIKLKENLQESKVEL